MDKAKLFAARLATDTHDVDGVGTVRFRALSREEALRIRDEQMPVDVMERKLLAMAMVDPVLTENEVAQWQAASPAGELEPITTRIAQMSGMEAKAAKDAAKRFRGKP